jgi:hypothetical protein
MKRGMTLALVNIVEMTDCLSEEVLGGWSAAIQSWNETSVGPSLIIPGERYVTSGSPSGFWPASARAFRIGKTVGRKMQSYLKTTLFVLGE